MADRFIQKRIILDEALSSGKLKVSKLMSLLTEHPYFKSVEKTFKTEEIADEYIVLDFIDTVFNRLKSINEHYQRFSISAKTKDITLQQAVEPIADVRDLPLVFNFEEYQLKGAKLSDLSAYAIYDSKNTFFDEYDMSKFANRLFKEGLTELADYNTNFFKKLALKNKNYNKNKSFRLVASKDELFVRGITSVDRYFEYGIDFTFVVAMLCIHQDTKTNPGNEYAITYAAASESKLEIILRHKQVKDAGEFGKVSSAMKITTNDIGQGSLNFTKIIRIGGRYHNGIYLFPTNKEQTQDSQLSIPHSTGPKKTLEKLKDVGEMLNNTDPFIEQLHDIKRIKRPDEIRARILNKLINPKSSFKEIKTLQDIFRTKIDNEIKDFAKLLAMCNKAEELDIDYDLKEKLRYLVSDTILSDK